MPAKKRKVKALSAEQLEALRKPCNDLAKIIFRSESGEYNPELLKRAYTLINMVDRVESTIVMNMAHYSVWAEAIVGKCIGAITSQTKLDFKRIPERLKVGYELPLLPNDPIFEFKPKRPMSQELMEKIGKVRANDRKLKVERETRNKQADVARMYGHLGKYAPSPEPVKRTRADNHIVDMRNKQCANVLPRQKKTRNKVVKKRVLLQWIKPSTAKELKKSGESMLLWAEKCEIIVRFDNRKFEICATSLQKRTVTCTTSLANPNKAIEKALAQITAGLNKDNKFNRADGYNTAGIDMNYSRSSRVNPKTGKPELFNKATREKAPTKHAKSTRNTMKARK